MRLQRALTMSPYTQGAATLYPGLCSSALTARAGQPGAVAKLCVGNCKALRGQLQSFAWAVAKLCVGNCKALRRQLQSFASETAKQAWKSSVLYLLRQEGGKTHHTGHCSPKEIPANPHLLLSSPDEICNKQNVCYEGAQLRERVRPPCLRN